VKSSQESFKDYNLLIEKELAEINTIEINYRLLGRTLNMELLINELDSGKTK
jgi:isopentenyl diphosphate isomerase/L-lactate dehydrogenase-like FMN-dependent dehydrogenase